MSQPADYVREDVFAARAKVIDATDSSGAAVALQLENLLTIVYGGKPMPVQRRRVVPGTSLYSSVDRPRGPTLYL